MNIMATLRQKRRGFVSKHSRMISISYEMKCWHGERSGQRRMILKRILKTICEFVIPMNLALEHYWMKSPESKAASTLLSHEGGDPFPINDILSAKWMPPFRFLGSSFSFSWWLWGSGYWCAKNIPKKISNFPMLCGKIFFWFANTECLCYNSSSLLFSYETL